MLAKVETGQSRSWQILAKVELAKVGLAKVELAKVGIGQSRPGQSRPSCDVSYVLIYSSYVVCVILLDSDRSKLCFVVQFSQLEVHYYVSSISICFVSMKIFFFLWFELTILKMYFQHDDLSGNTRVLYSVENEILDFSVELFSRWRVAIDHSDQF